MLTNKVFSGKKISLFEMLEAREQRQSFQNELMTKHPSDTLLSITLNIPGQVKNSIILEQFFNKELTNLQNLFKDEIIAQFKFNKTTGNEAFLILKINPLLLKKQLIVYEESKSKRRILDLDVLYLKNGDLTILSRKDLNMPSRKCLICEKNVKVCSRERKHSVEEICEKILELISSSE